MFGIGQTRENVKKINKVASDGNIDQLKLNIFMLMRDMCFYSSDAGYIKDMYIVNTIAFKGNTEQEINNLFHNCSSDYATDFIKELITPEVIESRFVSKKQFDLLRDIYSLDGGPLKSFSDMRKKYGKNFDAIHTNIISNLKEAFSFENDLIYLHNYLGGKDYSLDNYIVYNNEDEKEKSTFGYTIQEAIDIIYSKKELDDTEVVVKDNQNMLLMFFLEKEFMVKTMSENVGMIDGYPKEKSTTIDSRLNEILQGDVTNFVQHICEKYQIDFKPTDGMIAEFNKFKNYYKECKLLGEKNNLLYAKNKSNNEDTIHLIYGDESPVNEDDMTLYDFCIENNDKLDNALGEKKRFF